MTKLRDPIGLKGKVEIFASRGAPVFRLGKLLNPVESKDGRAPKIHDRCGIDFGNANLLWTETIYNIIVNQGKDLVINSLTTGYVHPLVRMAIGDRGTIPSDQTVPKVPDPTMTALYDEVYRADVDVTTLDVGTPTVHSLTLVKTFSSTVIPVTAFSNQANPIVNEVGLISADLLGGMPLPRPADIAPYGPGDEPAADEALFAIRTFKSVPFDAASEIAITIRYTIFIE